MAVLESRLLDGRVDGRRSRENLSALHKLQPAELFGSVVELEPAHGGGKLLRPVAELLGEPRSFLGRRGAPLDHLVELPDRIVDLLDAARLPGRLL
jgi:hypothetical protein